MTIGEQQNQGTFKEDGCIVSQPEAKHGKAKQGKAKFQNNARAKAVCRENLSCDDSATEH